MTTIRRKTVVKNRRRFVTFMVCTALALYFIIAGFVTPNGIKADQVKRVETVIVCSGDTLWSIAKDHAGGSADLRKVVSDIRAVNNLSSGTIDIGQTLVLPYD